MLNEKVFIVSSSSSVYEDFFSFLENTFSNATLYDNIQNLTKDLESLNSNSTSNSCPLVLFVEYSLLSELCPYLDNNMDNSSYILIGFDNETRDSIANFGNIFDFVNTGMLNGKFLINKLSNEIYTKRNIHFLKYELKEFYEIGKSLSYEKDTFKLLKMIIISSINLTSSDAGTIYLVIDKHSYNWTSIKDNNYEDKLLKFVISKNMSMDIDLEAHTSPVSKDSIFGYSIITGKPLRIDDAYNLDPYVEYTHNNSFDLKTGYITKSILSIPMKDHENNILGVIQLINKKKNKNEKIDYSDSNSLNNIIAYDSSDELIMSSLAGQAAVVLENNLLYSDMQVLLDNLQNQNVELDILRKRILKAHEEERKRIARDIHDGPAQTVANLSLQLELARKYYNSGMTEKGLEELDSLNCCIKETSKEIRSILYDLKPSYLEEGLIKALQNRLAIFEESTGLHVDFNVTGDDKQIDYYIVYAFYRMVQETLTNIQKHAHATNVLVDFRIYDNSVSIQITDDGVGFDIETQLKKHNTIYGGFGLNGLKERVEMLKGRFDLQSAPGQGTSLIIYIPL